MYRMEHMELIYLTSHFKPLFLPSHMTHRIPISFVTLYTGHATRPTHTSLVCPLSQLAIDETLDNPNGRKRVFFQNHLIVLHKSIGLHKQFAGLERKRK